MAYKDYFKLKDQVLKDGEVFNPFTSKRFLSMQTVTGISLKKSHWCKPVHSERLKKWVNEDPKLLELVVAYFRSTSRRVKDLSMYPEFVDEIKFRSDREEGEKDINYAERCISALVRGCVFKFYSKKAEWQSVRNDAEKSTEVLNQIKDAMDYLNYLWVKLYMSICYYYTYRYIYNFRERFSDVGVKKSLLDEICMEYNKVAGKPGNAWFVEQEKYEEVMTNVKEQITDFNKLFPMAKEAFPYDIRRSSFF